MCRFPLAILPVLLVALTLTTGCMKDDQPDNLSVPRLMIESRGVNYGALGGELVTLPVSGTSIQIQSEPLVHEFDIFNVDMVKVDMGIALLIQVSPKGARELYRGSVSSMGGRIVLTVNGNAIGARRIDGAIQDGNLYTFVEVDDEELGQLVLDIKKSLVHLQANK